MITVYSAQGKFTGKTVRLTDKSITILILTTEHNFTMTFERSKVRVVWPQAFSVKLAA